MWTDGACADSSGAALPEFTTETLCIYTSSGNSWRGGVNLVAGDVLSLSSGQTTYIQGAGGVDLTETGGNVEVVSTCGTVEIISEHGITATATEHDVTITAASNLQLSAGAGVASIDGASGVAIASTVGDVTMTSARGDLSANSTIDIEGDGISLLSSGDVVVNATNQVSLEGSAGVAIQSLEHDVTMTAASRIMLSAQDSVELQADLSITLGSAGVAAACVAENPGIDDDLCESQPGEAACRPLARRFIGASGGQVEMSAASHTTLTSHSGTITATGSRG